MRPLPRELCCLWYAALQAELLPPVCSDLSLQLDVTTSERFLHMWSHRNCFHFPGSITDVPAEQGQCFQLTVDELSDTDGPEPPGGTARFTLVGHHIICVLLVTSSKVFQNKCCCTVPFSNWIKWYDQHKNYTIYSIHTYIHTYIDIYIYTHIYTHTLVTGGLTNLWIHFLLSRYSMPAATFATILTKVLQLRLWPLFRNKDRKSPPIEIFFLLLKY